MRHFAQLKLLSRHFLSCTLSRLCSQRYITSSQTATALRPFYFAVHPDLFGLHPKQRVINENSLKHLNEFLGKLLNNKQVQPITLRFYIRSQEKEENDIKRTGSLREVHIKLLDKSVHDSIRTILDSCGLPLDYINTIRPVRKTVEQPRFQNIDVTFNAMYGMRDPQSPQTRAVFTLREWLDDNISTAKLRQDSIQPIREEVQRIREELISITGLKDVIWDSHWSQTQHRAVIKGLLRLCTNHRDINIKDQVIILTGDTGVCCHGNIMLKSNEIAESWLWILKSVMRYKPLLIKLPTLELYLSTLLNGANILKAWAHPTLVQVYVTEIRRLTSAIKNHVTSYPGELKEKLNDLQVTIECMAGPILMSPSGVIRVSSTSPGFLVIDYLNKHASEARQTKLSHSILKASCESLISRCSSYLQLESLTHSENITPSEVKACCEQLLKDADSIPISIHGASLQISRFSSVTSEGLLCIPWNYGELAQKR